MTRPKRWAPGPPPPAEERRDGFLFRSDSLALDFASTLSGRLKKEQRELLGTTRDLSRWLIAAGLSTEVLFPTESELLEARSLREALYSLARSCIESAPFDAESSVVLNRWARESPPAPQLNEQGLSLANLSIASCLAMIAREGVELFGGPLAARVRNCSREGCGVLFVDRSPSGKRRWCSMSACGNKMKVKAFRRRKVSEKTPPLIEATDGEHTEV